MEIKGSDKAESGRESGISGTSGVSGAPTSKEAIEQLNRRYWQAVIDMAMASGQDEREWCRANGVAINTYERYRRLLAVNPGNQSRKALIGSNRERYVEINPRRSTVEKADERSLPMAEERR